MVGNQLAEIDDEKRTGQRLNFNDSTYGEAVQNRINTAPVSHNVLTVDLALSVPLSLSAVVISD